MGKPNNPPAFPARAEFRSDGMCVKGAEEGMYLRDYFAAGAMQAELSTAGMAPEARDALLAAAMRAGRTPLEQLAFNAYEVADAMLRERMK